MTASTPARRRRRQLGLRARVTVAFALGALALSTILSVLTYGLVRNNLVQQREASAVTQAFVNARVARDGLRAPQAGGLTRVLGSLESQGRGGVVLHVEDRWFASSLVMSRDVLPAPLRDRVEAGTPAQQRFRAAGEPWLAVGVPLPRVGAQFFEAFSLAEVDRTLGVLSYSLAGAALLTTMAGAAVGRWASARVLRPLGSVSEAAAAIAGGSLDIRLSVPTDKDLAPLADSFNSMVAALSDRIQRDARFASDVSHELRSPLTTLSTSLEVLQARRGELSERSQAALDLLDADVRRFHRMVEDLLEISRFDAGVATLEVEEVDVRELVHHALGRTGEGVPLTVEDIPDGATVLGDKRRLERIVANLVENAGGLRGRGHQRRRLAGGRLRPDRGGRRGERCRPGRAHQGLRPLLPGFRLGPPRGGQRLGPGACPRGRAHPAPRWTGVGRGRARRCRSAVRGRAAGGDHGRSVRRLATRALLVAVVIVSGACGVRDDSRPRGLATADVPYGLLEEAPPTTLPPRTPTVPVVPVNVYFVRGERMFRAVRPVNAPASVAKALTALLFGPEEAEAVQGVRSAIDPTAAVQARALDGGTYLVDLSFEFAQGSATEQALGLAQIVYTATDVPGVTGVRFSLNGAPIQVPTLAGSTGDPVGRDAFAHLAPLPEEIAPPG